MGKIGSESKRAVIFMGPPGSGKGTYGKPLVEEMRGVYLSTGEALRERSKRDLEFAQRVQACMDAGELVGDNIILDVVRGYLQSVPTAPMVLLDGAVRTPKQAIHVVPILRSEGYEPIITLQLDLSREECRKRLLNRNEGRADDTPETIERRLDEYFHPLPKIERHLRSATQFISVSTLGTKEEVHQRVRDALQNTVLVG